MSIHPSENWASRARRAWIEQYAHANGHLYRGDIMLVFGISRAQASMDIHAVLELHPRCLTYDGTAKRYVWTGKKPRIPLPEPIHSFDLTP